MKLFSDNTEILTTYIDTDSRESFSSKSPTFLESYGKIYAKKSYGSSDCTGVLVSDDINLTESKYVITAHHCIDSFLEKESCIGFKKKDNSFIKREFKILFSNVEYDYSILELNSSISNIKPLIISKLSYEELTFNSLRSGVIPKLLSGGYSNDIFVGENGDVLTYSSNCSILRNTRILLNETHSLLNKEYIDIMSKKKEQKIYLHTNCIGYPGVSGGGLVYSVGDESFSKRRVINYLIGVNVLLRDSDPSKLSAVSSQIIYNDFLKVTNK